MRRVALGSIIPMDTRVLVAEQQQRRSLLGFFEVGALGILRRGPARKGTRSALHRDMIFPDIIGSFRLDQALGCIPVVRCCARQPPGLRRSRLGASAVVSPTASPLTGPPTFMVRMPSYITVVLARRRSVPTRWRCLASSAPGNPNFNLGVIGANIVWTPVKNLHSRRQLDPIGPEVLGYDFGPGTASLSVAKPAALYE